MMFPLLLQPDTPGGKRKADEVEESKQIKKSRAPIEDGDDGEPDVSIWLPNLGQVNYVRPDDRKISLKMI